MRAYRTDTIDREVSMSARNDVDRINEQLSACVKSADLKSIVEMYDDEAIFLLAGAPTYRGKQGITALFTEFLSNGPVDMTFTTGDVFESGDLVVDVGTYALGGDAESGERYVVVYRRRPDGSLALLVDAPLRPEAPTSS
jgi:ketosteroid isomerase-like protein